jgi:hypothetical protein
MSIIDIVPCLDDFDSNASSADSQTFSFTTDFWPITSLENLACDTSFLPSSPLSFSQQSFTPFDRSDVNSLFLAAPMKSTTPNLFPDTFEDGHIFGDGQDGHIFGDAHIENNSPPLISKNNKSALDMCWTEKQLSMPLAEFKAYLKTNTFPPERLKALKEARRRRCNRRYSNMARSKKGLQFEELSAKLLLAHNHHQTLLEEYSKVQADALSLQCEEAYLDKVKHAYTLKI